METGSYVDSKFRVCFFFFFLRAFSQLPFLVFFFTFDSCTIFFPFFFFLNLSGMLKTSLLACSFHISFLSSFLLLIKARPIIIFLLLRIFFVTRSFFFTFSFSLQVPFPTIDMCLFSRTLKECGCSPGCVMVSDDWMMVGMEGWIEDGEGRGVGVWMN